MATIHPFGDKRPDIHESVFLAAGSVVTGDVSIGKETSVWYNAVIRGDVAKTVIGERTSIQDNATLHQSPGNPLMIEDEVIVGHNAVLHSCIVRRGAMIGMGAIVLDGAEIGEGAMVGAGALVPPGKKVPPRTLVVGTPAKPQREVNETDLADMRRIVDEYVTKGQYYKKLES